MNTLPPEVKFHEFWQHLDYKDIIRLCETDIMFSSICESNYVWQDLIKRDFGFTYTGDNARNLYLLYNHALDIFSKYLPIITQTALSTLVTYIPTSEWNDLEKSILSYLSEYDESGKYYPYIMTLNTLFLVLEECDPMRTVLFETPPSFEFYHELIRKVADRNLLYSKLDNILDHLFEDGCDDFLSIVSYPSLVFVNKRLTIIDYDYELVEIISFEICYDKRNAIEKELIAKLIPL